MDAKKTELTTNELIDRGWTRTLIKKFLPRPDGCVAVDHWANFRGQDTYASAKVWNVEQSDEFAKAFLRSWKGRKKGFMKHRNPEDVLHDIRATPYPKPPKRTKEDVKRDTAVAQVAALFEEARARGYRTPHK